MFRQLNFSYSDAIDDYDTRFLVVMKRPTTLKTGEVVFDDCNSVRLVGEIFENGGGGGMLKVGAGPKIEKFSLTTPTLRFVNKLGIQANHNPR